MNFRRLSEWSRPCSRAARAPTNFTSINPCRFLIAIEGDVRAGAFRLCSRTTISLSQLSMPHVAGSFSNISNALHFFMQQKFRVSSPDFSSPWSYRHFQQTKPSRALWWISELLQRRGIELGADLHSGHQVSVNLLCNWSSHHQRCTPSLQSPVLLAERSCLQYSHDLMTKVYFNGYNRVYFCLEIACNFAASSSLPAASLVNMYPCSLYASLSGGTIFAIGTSSVVLWRPKASCLTFEWRAIWIQYPRLAAVLATRDRHDTVRRYGDDSPMNRFYGTLCLLRSQDDKNVSERIIGSKITSFQRPQAGLELSCLIEYSIPLFCIVTHFAIR